MTTGDAPERFAVVPTPNPMGTEGTALTRVGEPFVEGPGTATVAVRASGINACSPTSNQPHGEEPNVVGLDVDLPANTTSTLVAPYASGRWAPWLDSPLTLNFEIRSTPIAANSAPGTLPADQTITTPAPRPTGRVGVHILFDTNPESSLHGRLPERVIKRGKAIDIRGRTIPAIPGQQVLLRYYGPGHKRTFKTLARATVDRHGRFRVDNWHPKKTGYYEVWARYTSRRSGQASDYACPRVFKVAR